MKKKYTESPASKRFDQQLFSGDEAAFAHVYNLYRKDFINFLSKNYSIDTETSIEIYQESFLVLWQNIRSGKINKFDFSLRSYLLEIGKRKSLAHLRRKKKLVEDALNETSIVIVPEPVAEEYTDEQKIALDVVSRIEEPCLTVLTLYYWHDKSLAEIAAIMNYSSEHVAKNRKSLCMKKVRDKLSDELKKHGNRNR